MPRRIPAEVMALIQKLLLKGMAPLEVQDWLQAKKGYIVSPGPIYREAEILERMGKIERARTVRSGKSSGGRKKLAEGEIGKRWSPHRQRVLELRKEGWSLLAIAAEVGLSKQGVAKLLRTPDDTKPADGEHKTE